MFGVPSLYDSFDELFNEFNDLESFNSNQLMKTDVVEKDGQFLVDIDLPGFNKEDIHLALNDGYLTINASHQSNNDKKDDDGKIIRNERYYGSCSRSFYVGDQIKTEDVKAKFENGVLSLIVPKQEVEKIENNNVISIE